MKRILLVWTLCLMFLLSSCGNSSVVYNTGKEGTLSVVTTIFPPYDFARNIGGDAVSVTQLLRPGAESHSFDPTPADLILLSECNVFICVGGESDTWVDTLIENCDNPNMVVLRMMDMVDTVAEEVTPDMTVHEAYGESDDIEYDEHVWTSPVMAETVCRGIEEAFCQVDAEHSDEYHANADTYCEELEQLDAFFRDVVEGSENRMLIFGDRFPFRYLCEEYGISYRAAFPGCSSEAEPSAGTIASLITAARENGIHTILKMEMSSSKVAEILAEETDGRVLSLHSCHNRTAEETAEDCTYIQLMYENAEVLRVALGNNVS